MNWPIPDAAVALIKSAEGLRLEAYHCPAGILTIGYGHTGPDVQPGQEITDERADELLARDICKAADAVKAQCKVAPNANQLGAMTSLAFNIGAGAFAGSTVLAQHNLGHFAAAELAFAAWNKGTVGGKKVVLPGLVKRRAAEATLYRQAV